MEMIKVETSLLQDNIYEKDYYFTLLSLCKCEFLLRFSNYIAYRETTSIIGKRSMHIDIERLPRLKNLIHADHFEWKRKGIFLRLLLRKSKLEDLC